jgi:hypothetical protein
MALELRPNCEHCDTDLPPTSTEARICSYECTFCATCVAEVLHDVCPNCGGGFERRPIRPTTEWRPGVSLDRQPASTNRRHRTDDPAEYAALQARLRNVPPGMR